MVLGDARLTLAESADRYDLIVLDAFSSDAIPIHLMTREAMATYLSKLAPGGIVLMHISNRHLELGSVVAGIAHANGLVSRVNNRAAREGDDDAKYIFTSNVVISAREEKDFGQLREDKDWTDIAADPKQRVWTDDYSNVLGAIVRNLRGAQGEDEEDAMPSERFRVLQRRVATSSPRSLDQPTARPIGLSRCSRTASPAARTCSRRAASPKG